MSQENVEVVERGYAAWREGGIEAAIGLLHTDFELVQDPRFPGAQAYHGADGFRDWYAAISETLEQTGLELERAIDCPEDRVLAVVDLWGRGRESGVDVRIRMAHLWTIRDAKVSHVQFFLDPTDALEAVGLRE